MFSDVIKAALEREIAGQPRAINTVVRGATRVVSGLTPRERSFCVYLLMGPPGTGKTHTVSTITRLLRGDERELVTVSCAPIAGLDSWTAMAMQLAALTSPPAIVCIDYLERAPKELLQSLAYTLETGKISLQGGRSVELRSALIFITSGLCSLQILDETPRIGFAGTLDEDDEDPEDRLLASCKNQAEEHFGRDLMAQLDALVIFRRLEPEHLPHVLGRRVERLNDWLSRSGLTCELEEPARHFLIERGSRDLRYGARDLVRAHQKFVEFPLADLLVSRRVPPGGSVRIDRKPGEDRLHFTVRPKERSVWPPPVDRGVRRIPVG